MQCVAGNDCIRAAVEGVPRQRVADIRHMDADLMSAPGAEPAGHQTVATAQGQHLIFRQAVLAVLPHAAANDGITPPRNRGLYPAAAQWHCPCTMAR